MMMRDWQRGGPPIPRRQEEYFQPQNGGPGPEFVRPFSPCIRPFQQVYDGYHQTVIPPSPHDRVPKFDNTNAYRSRSRPYSRGSWTGNRYPAPPCQFNNVMKPGRLLLDESHRNPDQKHLYVHKNYFEDQESYSRHVEYVLRTSIAENRGVPRFMHRPRIGFRMVKCENNHHHNTDVRLGSNSGHNGNGLNQAPNVSRLLDNSGGHSLEHTTTPTPCKTHDADLDENFTSHPVAVEPPEREIYEDDNNPGQSDEIDENEEILNSDIASSSQEEEYEPEHPEIICKSEHSKLIRGRGESKKELLMHDMTSVACDNDGFYQVFVSICISSYPTGYGRKIDVAGYGVWFSDGNKCNFGGVLDTNRPQTLKPVSIEASALAIKAMKAEGYSRIRLNLESDYLNKNVCGWISKYIKDPNAQPSNWDEYKYQPEINNLCTAASGMIIKWSHHIADGSITKGLQKAKEFARNATDAWIKELRFRDEAVGTKG